MRTRFTLAATAATMLLLACGDDAPISAVGCLSDLDCAGYVCSEAGACGFSCVDAADCATGHVCTAGGTCEDASPPEDTSDAGQLELPDAPPSDDASETPDTPPADVSVGPDSPDSGPDVRVTPTSCAADETLTTGQVRARNDGDPLDTSGGLARFEPFGDDYDAGLTAIVAAAPLDEGASVDVSLGVVSATVAATSFNSPGNLRSRSSMWLQDGNSWVRVFIERDGDGFPEGSVPDFDIRVGHRVSFTATRLGNYRGMRQITMAADWSLDSEDNEVYVRELGAARPLAVDQAVSLVRATGTVREVERADCGGFSVCYSLDYGADELATLRTDIPWVEPGACVTFVGPVTLFDGAPLLDAINRDWLGVYGAPEPPRVIAVTPAHGSEVPDDGTLHITAVFDIPVRVDPAGGVPITVSLVNLDTGSELGVRHDWASGDGFPRGRSIEVQLGGVWLRGGDTYECTISGFPSADGVPMAAPYSWSWRILGCGDGVCSADETLCSCSIDCGRCDGCCRDGVCLPGTANNACGRGGASCGVCLPPDQCVDGGAGCL